MLFNKSPLWGLDWSADKNPDRKKKLQEWGVLKASPAKKQAGARAAAGAKKNSKKKTQVGPRVRRPPVVEKKNATARGKKKAKARS